MEFAIDTSREQLVATGTVRPVEKFGEKDVQEKNAAGVLLWDIDVIKAVRQFGKPATVVIAVRVPCPKEPEIAPFQPLALEHPTVSAYLGKGGTLKINIAAAGLVGGAGSRGRGSSEAA